MNNKNIDMEPPLKKTKEDDKPLDEFAALRKAYRANRKKIMVSCSHVYCHPNFLLENACAYVTHSNVSNVNWEITALSFGGLGNKKIVGDKYWRL